MKPGIHPSYKDATVTCACGATYTTRSTRGSFTVDVCSNCHPFYTGTQKLNDAAGRVDRFRKSYGAEKKAEKPAVDKAEKAEKVEKTEAPSE